MAPSSPLRLRSQAPGGGAFPLVAPSSPLRLRSPAPGGAAFPGVAPSSPLRLLLLLLLLCGECVSE